MDIYRFFHPHHNPRLHSTPVRLQELLELEQAAAELRKALERALRRTKRKRTGPVLPSHFNDIIKAMRFVEASLQTLGDAHEGDSEVEMNQLLHERSNFSGWEAWVTLLRQQLLQQEEDTVHKKNIAQLAVEESEAPRKKQTA